MWDEVHRIACEAVRNAFLHAQARRIEVEIRYDRRQLLGRVRDNGKGIDPNILDGGGRAGHHGWPGMRERAELVRGKLAVRSKIDSGTEVELTIPPPWHMLNHQSRAVRCLRDKELDEALSAQHGSMRSAIGLLRKGLDES